MLRLPYRMDEGESGLTQLYVDTHRSGKDFVITNPLR